MSRFSVWNIKKNSGRAMRSHYLIGEKGILFTNLPEQSLKYSNFHAGPSTFLDYLIGNIPFMSRCERPLGCPAFK